MRPASSRSSTRAGSTRARSCRPRRRSSLEIARSAPADCLRTAAHTSIGRRGQREIPRLVHGPYTVHRMKRAIAWLFALAFLAAAGFVGWRLFEERRFVATRFGEGSRTVVVPPGTGPRALAKLLADARIVSDANLFYTHLHWFRRNAHTKAGEYQFDGALLPDEVIGKMVRGEVKLYRFTAAEGLRVDEIATIVG